MVSRSGFAVSVNNEFLDQEKCRICDKKISVHLFKFHQQASHEQQYARYDSSSGHTVPSRS